MYRLHASILRFIQALGLVMAVAGSGAAITWALQGQNGDALIATLVAFAAVGFVGLAGWMRRGARKAAEFFPPHVR